jgi:hypothetical protein
MPILASMVLLLLSFFTAPWLVEADKAGEAPPASRLRGQSYGIAATSDPLGICYRSCCGPDAADGFVLGSRTVRWRPDQPALQLCRRRFGECPAHAGSAAQ